MSNVHIPSLRSFIQGIRPSPRLMFMFRNRFIFYGEGLLAPRTNPKLEDRPFSSVRGCLFNVFTANLHSWWPSLYPRPEDAPCCSDRDPPYMDTFDAVKKIIIAQRLCTYFLHTVCLHFGNEIYFCSLDHYWLLKRVKVRLCL
jgi:hypothetical protein